MKITRGHSIAAAIVISALLSLNVEAKEKWHYKAAESNLPPWAEQGRFRFLRLDGGRIESMKAERTFWGREFDDEEKDVLAKVYTAHFDKLLARLKEARFNWIWVTWSNGWSLETEAENRRDLAKVIAACHAEGIRVTAYMSAANMFWKDMYKEEPASMAWGFQLWGVIPVFYLGLNQEGLDIAWERRLADAGRPQWRDYLINKAALAVEAGADAVMYDNMIGETQDLQALLDETQAMIEAKSATSGAPKPMLYANIHIDPGRFAMNESCEVVWEEDGKDTPGVHDGRWNVENARKIKFLRGEKQAWQPLKFEYDRYHCGPREKCIPGPAEQKLMIAEAHAFGAGLSRNIEGRFLADLVMERPGAVAAWEAIAEYNQFLAEHEDLYHGVKSAAKIALLSEGPDNPAADLFLRNSVLFETKVLDHLDKGEPLENFDLLVVPFRLRKVRPAFEIYEKFPLRARALSAKNLALLRAFAEKGGRVIALDPRDFPGAAALNPEKIVEQSCQAAPGSCLTVHSDGHLIAHASRAADGAFILHLINYGLDKPARDIRVEGIPFGKKPAIRTFALDTTGMGIVYEGKDEGPGLLKVSHVARYAVFRFTRN